MRWSEAEQCEPHLMKDKKIVLQEIPRPAGENAGLRNDALYKHPSH